MSDADNPALHVRQPIGYVAPLDGRKLVHGLAIHGDDEPPARSLSSAALPFTTPDPTTGPGSGQIVNGFGQAATPTAGVAPLTGLNCT